MDKNSIKKYAIWARRELISRVSQKALQFGISEKEIIDPNVDSVYGHILSAVEKQQRKALIARIRNESYEQVMEEIAYTWFNRFIALRFMEVNGYLPTHVRVFTNGENAFSPQILTEAIHLEIDGLDMERVYAFKEANDDEALYKYLLITQCNALSSILPGVFQRISDYTELLFPDNILREGSVIEQMISMIAEADWQDAVQIIGWLYQYYNTEPKDKVFTDLKRNIKISKEKIPAATQLFTPDWIVRYMVENSLGRLWLESHPNDALKANWKYYLEEAEQTPEVAEKLRVLRAQSPVKSPEDIRLIDPCMGSGHILVYAFDVLMQIYESEGYSARDAAKLILEKNLYGIDIDDRAYQLSYFALMMKARQYDKRLFTHHIEPNICAVQESNGLHVRECEGDRLSLLDLPRSIAEYLIEVFQDAKEYGSLIDVREDQYDALSGYLEELKREGASNLLVQGWLNTISERMPALIKQAKIMSMKFDVVVTNPPYMGSNGMGSKLTNYVKEHFPDSKSDLSTCFMEKSLDFCRKQGFVSMINIPVWMFISSYEKLRIKIHYRNSYMNMVHFGRGVFGSDFGTVAFVISKTHYDDYSCVYRRLFKNQGAVDSIDQKEKWFLGGMGYHSSKQEDFIKIPGCPVAYWVSDRFIKIFTFDKINSIAISDGQTKTGDNERFLRFVWEVSSKRIGKMMKWSLIAKGGDFRRWYGNIEYLIDWSDHARRHYRDDHVARIAPEYIWYREGLCWNHITSSSKFAVRLLRDDMLFETAAPSIFIDDKQSLYYAMGYLNSVVGEEAIKLINPTMCTNVSDVTKQPLNIVESMRAKVVNLVKQSINLSCDDWDLFESSSSFKSHPLVACSYLAAEREVAAIGNSGGLKNKVATYRSIELAFEAWEHEAAERFNALKANEEELNRIFIDIYGLQDELTPEVEDKDVTVRRADLGREIRSLISYAVGCMFGRYSLDVEGLAYAGGDWDENKYITFPADRDNIIPICDDEYFADDIVGRFIRFIEVVYGKETLAENLRFIADALGGSGQPKAVIRNYFLNGFYADHLKVYQKRPIYWLFDSGKKGGFKALIYMHRYQPDTLARMRTDYVHEQQARYHTAIGDLQQRMASASSSERVKLSKQLQKLQSQAEELRVYEEKIHHLADQMIRIDLDDGVKHNYEIFKDVLATI